MADNLNNFKELNFKTCNLDLGWQYITVSRTIKPQEDLIFWKLTRQFLQTQAWTWKIPHLHLCTFEKKENSRSTKIIPKHLFVHIRKCKNFMKIKLSALAWIFSLKKISDDIALHFLFFITLSATINEQKLKDKKSFANMKFLWNWILLIRIYNCYRYIFKLDLLVSSLTWYATKSYHSDIWTRVDLRLLES